MPLFLLDTNIVSYFLRQESPRLNSKIHDTPADAMCLSAVTEAELRFGVERLPHEARLRRLVSATVSDFEIMPWNSTCAQQYALLAVAQERDGKPLGHFDTMIAAHALALNITLISNDSDFARVEGLRLENWTLPA